MAIRYYRLFAFLKELGKQKTDLLDIMSAPTLAKLGKGEIVTTEVIDRICHYLKCQPADIMECYETKKYIDTKTGREYTREELVNLEELEEYQNSIDRTMLNEIIQDLVNKHGEAHVDTFFRALIETYQSVETEKESN